MPLPQPPLRTFWNTGPVCFVVGFFRGPFWNSPQNARLLHKHHLLKRKRVPHDSMMRAGAGAGGVTAGPCPGVKRPARRDEMGADAARLATLALSFDDKKSQKDWLRH